MGNQQRLLALEASQGWWLGKAGASARAQAGVKRKRAQAGGARAHTRRRAGGSRERARALARARGRMARACEHGASRRQDGAADLYENRAPAGCGSFRSPFSSQIIRVVGGPQKRGEMSVKCCVMPALEGGGVTEPVAPSRTRTCWTSAHRPMPARCPPAACQGGGGAGRVGEAARASRLTRPLPAARRIGSSPNPQTREAPRPPGHALPKRT